MKKGSILLPEGKKPFVMSQDDVCYYEYMEGDGFASRIIIGEDGKPTCEMKLDDGTVSVGSYDLIPILEDFIQEHPDFSYKGARAVIAFTGYNGILGYRTDEAYRETNPNFEADRQAAAEVAQCLRDNGWELASHSWGHRNLGTISFEDFQADSGQMESPCRKPHWSYGYYPVSIWKRCWRLASLTAATMPASSIFIPWDSVISAMSIPASTGFSSVPIISVRAAATWTATGCGKTLKQAGTPANES